MVLRAPILVMVPWMPVPSSTLSPTRTGRSARMMSPEMKLFMIFWLPKPTPMATAPPSTVKIVRGTSAT